MSEIILLTNDVIERSLKRITHEILERYKGADNVVLIGIKTRGIYLANRIAQNILTFEQCHVPVGELDITLYRDDRHSVQTKDPVVNGSNIACDLTGKHVVLVDDVLFTGRTIRAAMDATMDYGRAKTITVAVLIDRGHRELPIKADYVGKNIPTALNEAVHVHVLEKDGYDNVVLQRH